MFVRGSTDWGEVGLVQSGSVLSCPVLSVQPTWLVAFGDVEGQRGWLAGRNGLAIDQTVIPGEAGRRPGICAPLKELDSRLRGNDGQVGNDDQVGNDNRIGRAVSAV
ncbi:hypothetical protein [Thalassospira xiamenensis]|uniref:hypothetical protein n=1 Tax=Thalassospira xiamenensis TaxID=220697 RepID=UPI003AA7E3F4